MTAEGTLAAVAEQVRACTQCKLHQSRKNAVPGEGPPDAEILFIGEGPGFHENEQGRPFVCAAGKFLEELLATIGLRREQVYLGATHTHASLGAWGKGTVPKVNVG